MGRLVSTAKRVAAAIVRVTRLQLFFLEELLHVVRNNDIKILPLSGDEKSGWKHPSPRRPGVLQGALTLYKVPVQVAIVNEPIDVPELSVSEAGSYLF